ncbi:hypothetical protein [Hydrogenimonas sp.]
MAVGKSIITEKGIFAMADASVTGKLVQPKYFKFSTTDYNLDPALTDISGWLQKDISLYNKIDDNTVEFLCDVAPEEATDYARTAGLFLEDGTLFMLAKPPFPFPPGMRQTFKIQLVYQNAEQLIDFQYLPFYETEQDLMILEVGAQAGLRHLDLQEEIGLLQLAKADYYKFKGMTNDRLIDHENRIAENEEDIEELQLSQLDMSAELGRQILQNSLEISLVKSTKGA